MKNTARPETIENRWDILYRDYPEVYDEFASMPYSKTDVEVLRKIFKLKNKTVADIGSGSGLSTFQLAEYAKQVIGIEPEDSMRKLAVDAAEKRKLVNVKFIKGTAVNIPLEDDTVDMTVAITGAFFHDSDYVREFVKEASRITAPDGHIVTVNIAPRWYGGELASVILGKSRETRIDPEAGGDITLTGLGFGHRDYYSETDYKTVDKAVETYGFIFGKKAIDYLRTHNKTTIKWKFRIHYLEIV